MAIVWQISAIQFKVTNLVTGVILENPLSKRKMKVGIIRNFALVIASYFTKTYSNKNIIVVAGNLSVNTTTDNEGGFSVLINSKTINEIQIFPEGRSNPFTMDQAYPMFFYNTEGEINVISDIDDTILVSYTASLLKRLGTLFFVPPHNRKSVGFAHEILNEIQNKKGRVFYVSKSESNLFNVISTFILNRKVPQGGLFLTPYLSLGQLLNSKKGKDFKENSIRLIIDHSPEKSFILLGDDTQLDMLVYKNLAELYPNQIKKIYIRKTNKNLLGKKKQYFENLNKLPIPVRYFSDNEDVKEELTAINNIKDNLL